jgi:hypothetical protein
MAAHKATGSKTMGTVMTSWNTSPVTRLWILYIDCYDLMACTTVSALVMQLSFNDVHPALRVEERDAHRLSGTGRPHGIAVGLQLRQHLALRRRPGLGITR